MFFEELTEVLRVLCVNIEENLFCSVLGRNVSKNKS